MAGSCLSTTLLLTAPTRTNIALGGATITVTANASANTLQFEASGDGGTTWVALNATPSNSTTAVTSTTSTGVWQANVAGYTNIRVRCSTFVAGTATVSIVTSTASARSGGGGGSAFGTPPASPNGVTFTACETPSGGVAGTLGYCWPGITVTSQTGTTYQPLPADRSTCLEQSNAAAITDTIPDIGGTNFQFGYNFCVLNLGATTITVNNTSASKFNLLGVFHTVLATPATTFSIFAGDTAYFYSGSGINWDVNVVGSGVDATGVQAFYGSASITSAPPSGTPGNTGWKFCLYQALFCTGIAGSTEYHRLNTQNWLSVGAGAANNDSSGTGTDTAATTSMSSFGGLDFKENACSANFVPAASHTIACPDSTAHEILVNTAGDSMASHQGMLVRRQPVPINSTGLVAAVTTATLCAASAGACNVAGQYMIAWNIWGSGTACGTPSPGGVTISFTWTDENAVSHAAVIPAANSQTTATATVVNVTAPTMAFQSALANESSSGTYVLSSNGAAAIQYAVAYTACGAGTGTYNLRASAIRLQ